MVGDVYPLLMTPALHAMPGGGIRLRTDFSRTFLVSSKALPSRSHGRYPSILMGFPAWQMGPFSACPSPRLCIDGERGFWAWV